MRPKHYQTFPGGPKKLRTPTKVSPLKCPKGGFRASWEPLLASLCSLPSSVAAAVSGRTSHLPLRTSRQPNENLPRKKMRGLTQGGVAEPPDDWEPQLQSQIALLTCHFELRMRQTKTFPENSPGLWPIGVLDLTLPSLVAIGPSPPSPPTALGGQSRSQVGPLISRQSPSGLWRLHRADGS